MGFRAAWPAAGREVFAYPPGDMLGSRVRQGFAFVTGSTDDGFLAASRQTTNGIEILLPPVLF